MDVIQVPPALALIWMTSNFRDEVFGPAKGTSECICDNLRGGDDRHWHPTSSLACRYLPHAGTPLVSVDMTATSSMDSMPAPAASDAVASEAIPEPKLTLFEKAAALFGAFKPVYWQVCVHTHIPYMHQMA